MTKTIQISGTPDDNGNVLLSVNDAEKIISATCLTPGVYVSRLFLNQYDLWYAQVIAIDGGSTKNNVNIMICYI